jgi:hypothetical protein
MFKRVKQLFCKHDPKEYTKPGLFYNLSGDRIFLVCTKCGKEMGSYFKRH